MLGSPKYNYGDYVKVKLSIDGEEKEFIGRIVIIDKYGTFEDNSDVSYDIMVDNNNLLIKHCREDIVEFMRPSDSEEYVIF